MICRQKDKKKKLEDVCVCMCRLINSFTYEREKKENNLDPGAHPLK